MKSLFKTAIEHAENSEHFIQHDRISGPICEDLDGSAIDLRHLHNPKFFNVSVLEELLWNEKYGL